MRLIALAVGDSKLEGPHLRVWPKGRIMFNLHTPQCNTMTRITRLVYVIAAIEVVLNMAPTKVTIWLVGAALAVAIYDVSRQLKAFLIALTERHTARFEAAVQQHAEVVEADGRRHREAMERVTVDHAATFGDKIAKAERVAERAAVEAGLKVVQGYLDAQGGHGTHPFRVVR